MCDEKTIPYSSKFKMFIKKEKEEESQGQSVREIENSLKQEV